MINSDALDKGMEKVYLSLTIYICNCWSFSQLFEHVHNGAPHHLCVQTSVPQHNGLRNYIYMYKSRMTLLKGV